MNAHLVFTGAMLFIYQDLLSNTDTKLTPIGGGQGNPGHTM